jgi:DNA polymerase
VPSRRRRRATDRAPPVPVPAAFLALCESVILHRDPGRFRPAVPVAVRLRTEPALRHDARDPDRLQADRMAQAVRRDLNKMKACVRLSDRVPA